MRLADTDTRKGSPALLAVLVVVSLVVTTVYFREGPRGPLRRARTMALAVSRPLLAVGDGVTAPFRAVRGFFAGMGASRSEIETLRRQNAELRTRLASLEEARQENDRLRALVNFAEAKKFASLGARVIGRPTDPWIGVVTIDRGTADGIRSGMPVLAAQGLVGQVLDVSRHIARVRLITDQESGVAVLVQSTRAVGVVRGSIDRRLSLDFVDASTLPTVGDVVVTSGLGGVYPKGIVVGDVTDVERQRGDLYPTVGVRSRVPIDLIEEVLVLIGPSVSTGGGGE
ncbi:MAG: rod shape-determining protein MreC [Coriobacteriia bacterium]